MNLLNVYRGTTLVKSMLHTDADKTAIDFIKEIIPSDVIEAKYSETNDDMCNLTIHVRDISIFYKGLSLVVQPAYQTMVNSIPTG